MRASVAGRLSGEGGYSLVELISVLAILGGIVGAVTTLFVSGSKAELHMNDRFQAQNVARAAMDRMRRDVHCAASATGGGTTITLAYAETTCLGQSSVSWCTQAMPGVAGRFSLHRQAGGACTAASRQLADYLSASSVFTYQASSPTNLAKLKASLTFTRPAMRNAYRLCDVLVLRNSSRSGAGGTAVTCP